MSCPFSELFGSVGGGYNTYGVFADEDAPVGINVEDGCGVGVCNFCLLPEANKRPLDGLNFPKFFQIGLDFCLGGAKWNFFDDDGSLCLIVLLWILWVRCNVVGGGFLLSQISTDLGGKGGFKEVRMSSGSNDVVEAFDWGEYLPDFLVFDWKRAFWKVLEPDP